jgi:branched-chain amino acid transport system permease protein
VTEARLHALLIGAVCGALLALPALIPGFYASLLALTFTYVIAAVGVNLLTGYTGLVTVGHGGFFAIGAYATALMARQWGTSILPGLVAGAVVAALVGFALGIICLRLGGAFLAIATLGFALTIGAILNNVPFFDGREGITLGGNALVGIPIKDVGFYYLALATMALVMLFQWSIVRSGVGRAFIALRDSERPAEAMGVNVRLYKTLAFTLSAALTGIAGVLFAHHTSYVSAETFGNAWLSVDFLTAVVVGGQGSLLGSALGAAFVVLVPYYLGELRDFAFIVNGIALIAVLLFAPAGMAGLLARAVHLTVGGRPPRPSRPSSAPSPSITDRAIIGDPEPLTLRRPQLELTVTNLHVHFGGVHALDGVSLRVPARTVYGVIGPNGAGKTTLFNCISRFQPFERGEIRFRGQNLGRLGPHDLAGLGIARTFQNIKLFQSMSTLDNILVGMHVRLGAPAAAMLSLPAGRRREASMRAEAAAIAAMLGLDEVLEQQVSHLPLGYQKRVELARAIASAPKLLLLDEPVAGCNEEETQELAVTIRRINDQLGVTVVVVEHDMSLVASICDEVTVLDFGRVIARGAPAEIFNNPSVVEAYLGEPVVHA